MCRSKRPDLTAKTAGLERLLDEQYHFIEIERLVDVVVGTAFHRLDGVFNRRKRRHENDESLRRLLLDALQHCQSVAIRKLQIQENKVDSCIAHLNGCCRGVRFENLVPLLLQALLE